MRCARNAATYQAQYCTAPFAPWLVGSDQNEHFNNELRSFRLKDLMAMTVAELKEELAVRDEPISGKKAWLRRRLHSAIVRDYIDGSDF